MKKISNPIKKINIKDAGKKSDKKIGRTSRGSVPDSFDVNIRTSEPILTLAADKKKGSILNELLWTAVSALVPMAALALLLDLAYAQEYLPCLLAGVAVYIGYSVLRDRVSGKWRAISAGIIAVILIAVLVILRRYIGNGFALFANQIYEYAEYSQAYVYDMFPVGSAGE